MTAPLSAMNEDMTGLGLQIRFQGLPLWLLVPAAALAVYVLWRYRTFLLSIEFPRTTLALTLRAAALASVLLLAAGPVVYLRVKLPAQLHAAIVIDSSQSMQLKDGTGVNRRDRAVDAAKKVEAALRTTSLVYNMADTLAPIPTIEKTTPIGSETFLSDAPETLCAESDEPFSDVFIFTDGRDTSGARPSNNGCGARVHTIGIGRTGAEYNSGISEVHAPDYAFVDEAVAVEGSAYTIGAKTGEPVGIELYENGKLTGQMKSSVGREGEYNVPFTIKFTPKKTGLHALTVRVKLPQQEKVTEDNERTLFVDVVTEKRAVLYIDSPRWEFRFLSELLKSNDKFKTDTVVIGPGGTIDGGAVKSAIGSSAALDKYRIVIVGDAAEYLSGAEKQSLLSYVRGGGRLAALGGRRSLFTAGGGWSEALGAIDGGSAAGSPEGFEVTPTDTGWTTDILRLADGTDENRRLWKSLPFVQTFNRTSAPRGSVVLATHPWVRCRGGLCPLIYSSPAGNGQIFAVTFDGLWRWKFQEKEKDAQAYDRFWKNVLDDMLDTEREAPLTLRLSSRTATPGDEITASAHASAALLNSKATAILRIAPPSGQPSKVKMKRDPARAGVFTAKFKPAAVGRYSITAEYAGRVSDAEPLAVQVSPAEFKATSLNEEYLKKMSSLNGGWYAPENGAEKLALEALKTRGFRTVRAKKTAFVYPLILVALAGILAAEWMIRRRGGLS